VLIAAATSPAPSSGLRPTWSDKGANTISAVAVPTAYAANSSVVVTAPKRSYPAVIAQQRIVVRVRVQHVYGRIVAGGRRPIGDPGA
jgi:hypothetical protein